MAKAYLRICVEVGKERDVRDALRKMKGILSADLTAGEQDVLALAEGKSFEAILDLVVRKVRHLKGIKVTWTNLVLE